MRISKILSLLLIAIIAAILFGCGNSQTDTTENTSDVIVTEQSSSESYIEDSAVNETSDTTYSGNNIPDESAPTVTYPSDEQTTTQYNEPEINFSDLE